MFYSQKYELCGKIDIFEIDSGKLIERKSKIKELHKGYIYQLYAQMFGLQERGYRINSLHLHSIEDNKRYTIPLPSVEDIIEFEELIALIKDFDPISLLSKTHLDDNSHSSIYSNLAF